MPEPRSDVPRRRMRRAVTWMIAGGLLAVAIAGTVDALRGSPSRPETVLRNPYLAPSQAPSAASTDRLPTCTTRQLALAFEILGGSATFVLRHVRGEPCHLPRVPIRFTVRDRAGRRVRLVTAEGLDGRSAVKGDFSPGFEQLINIPYLPQCGPEAIPPGPFLASVRVGSYVARRTLSGSEVGCLGGG
jgi:hypothetical protein